MSKSITIDGPAAAGKTTTAKALAKNLPGFLYVDTGAFYRVFAYGLKRKNITYPLLTTITDIIDEKILHTIKIQAKQKHGEQTMYLNGGIIQDEYLRTEDISQLASAASAIPEVRAKINDAIREYAQNYDVIMEGRDTGTVILPDATVKFYLTADINARTERRYNDILKKEPYANKDDIKADLQVRDARDMNRKTDPLKIADTAIVIDNTNIPAEQCIQMMQKIIEISI